MAKRTKKPDAIPLESLFLDGGFQRNFEIEMRSSDRTSELKRAIMGELVSNAKANVLSKQSQRKKASLPRPKKNDRDTALDSVIRGILRHSPGEGPGALWVHFKCALEEWSGGEVHETGNGNSRSYRYEPGEDTKSIAIETFRKKVSYLRKGGRSNRP
jgi:hypothetical protein